MPFAIDPNERLAVVLDCDKNKSPRPTFYFKYLTTREWRQLSDLSKQYYESETVMNAADFLMKRVSFGLLGWENITDRNGNEIPFSLDALEDVIGPRDANDLMEKFLQQRPDADDKKKLESPSDFDGETPAKNVQV